MYYQWKRFKDSCYQLCPKALYILNIIGLILTNLRLFGMSRLQSGNILGFLILAVFLGNLYLAYINEKNKYLGYGYLLLSFLFMLVIPVGNTLASITPGNKESQNGLTYFCILILFILGVILAVKQFSAVKVRYQEEKTGKNLTGNILFVILCVILFSGLFLVVILLLERKFDIIEAIISEYAYFYAMMFLSLGVFVIKLPIVRKHLQFQTIIRFTVTVIFTVCMLPLTAVPVLIKNAELDYSNIFGNAVQKDTARLPQLFRSQPFSLTEYFFGIKSENYSLKENILFYQGRSGVEKGLKLYYDVYTPEEGKVYHEKYPVLVRIHGGGWTSGNKGKLNFAQMNKYFASQGYVVFDVQYGLSDAENLLIDLFPSDQVRKGKYSIDDMVRHIMIFLNYLGEHSEEYPVDLNTVFLSGGSAGGQLALAAGLKWTDDYAILRNENRISIKGLIPFYPAVGLAEYAGIDGEKDFTDPVGLIGKNSPPCLIYQGSHDRIVDPAIVKRFQKVYRSKGLKCAVIQMPFGGHASDLYFAGYYNQVFLYYMERFLYQFR